jgi:hypothetical protein
VGSPANSALACPSNGQYELESPEADRIYCFVFDPGKLTTGKTFNAGRGLLYRDAPERRAQEAGCP